MPDWHSVPGGHALSQPPQWLLSDCRSAHCQVATSVPHSCRPAGMQSGSTEVGMDGTELAKCSSPPAKLACGPARLADAPATCPVPVWQVQPSPAGQHWLVGMHCPLHSNRPVADQQKDATHTWVSQQRCSAYTPLAHALHSPQRWDAWWVTTHTCGASSVQLTHLLSMHNFPPGILFRRGMQCCRRRSGQHPTAGQSCSPYHPRHSWQSPAGSHRTLPCTRCCRRRRWCRCHNAAGLIAG